MKQRVIYSTVLFLILLSLVLIQACTARAVNDPDVPPFSAADEALYSERFKILVEALQTTGNVPPYDNLEPVAGTTDYQPLPRNLDSTAISRTALDLSLIHI